MSIYSLLVVKDQFGPNSKQEHGLFKVSEVSHICRNGSREDDINVFCVFPV